MFLYSHVACLLVHIRVRVWNFVVRYSGGGCGRRWDSDELEIYFTCFYIQTLLACLYTSLLWFGILLCVIVGVGVVGGGTQTTYTFISHVFIFTRCLLASTRRCYGLEFCCAL